MRQFFIDRDLQVDGSVYSETNATVGYRRRKLCDDFALNRFPCAIYAICAGKLEIHCHGDDELLWGRTMNLTDHCSRLPKFSEET